MFLRVTPCSISKNSRAGFLALSVYFIVHLASTSVPPSHVWPTAAPSVAQSSFELQVASWNPDRGLRKVNIAYMRGHPVPRASSVEITEHVEEPSGGQNYPLSNNLASRTTIVALLR